MTEVNFSDPNFNQRDPGNTFGNAQWNTITSPGWNPRLILVLSQPSLQGSYVIRGGEGSTYFSAEFTYNQTKDPRSSAPGDGFSFNYSDLPTSDFGETGAGQGLRIQFLANASRLNVIYGGQTLVSRVHSAADAQTHRVAVTYNGRLYLRHDNDLLVDGLSIPGWNPASNYKFGFGARNGAGYALVYLGTLKIITADSLRISGRVTSGGAGVAGAIVTAQNPQVSPAPFLATTDGQGNYQLDVPAVASYNLGCSQAGVTFAGPATAYAGQPADFTVSGSSPPSIVAPAQFAVLPGRATPIYFQVDDDTGPDGLTIAVSSADQSLVPDSALALSGTGSSRTLSVTAPARTSGQTTLVLTARDGQGNTATSSIVIELSEFPGGTALRFGNFYADADPDSGVDALAVGSPVLANSSFTIEAWLKPEQFGNTRIALSQGSASNVRYFHFGFIPNGAFIVQINNNNVIAQTPLDHQWHHWAASYDRNSTQVTIYRDGVQVGSGPAGVAYDGSGPLNIGRPAAGSGAAPFIGLIDEVRVWNVARSPADIRASMNTLVGPSNGLLSYYRFNEGPHGRVMIDSVGRASYRVATVTSSFPRANPVGSSVPVAGAPDLRGPGGFTIEAWLKRTQTDTHQFALSQSFPDVFETGIPKKDEGLHFGFRDSNVFTFAFWNDDLNTPQAYTDTDWHHWAATFDATTLERKLYRDGILVASDTAAGRYNGIGNLFVGERVGRRPWGGFPFSGQIDEVRAWTTVRSPAQIVEDMNTFPTPAPGLVASWRARFHGPSWMNGIGNRLPAYAPGVGTNAFALEFNGLGDFVEAPNYNTDSFTNGFTVEAWVNRSRRVPNQEAPIVSHATSAGIRDMPGDWVLTYGAGSDLNFITRAGFAFGILPGDDDVGRWHHIAAVYDGQNLKLYADGALLDNRPALRPMGSSSAPLWIGRAVRGLSFFAGAVDEVRVWNRARTDSEIRSAMHEVLPGATPGLVSYFRFNEGIGTETIEATRGSRHKIDYPAWVTGVPDGQSLFLAANSSVSFDLRGFDPDGSAVSYVFDAPPAFGQVSGSADRRTYTPARYYFGTDQVIYRAFDGAAYSAPASVKFSIASVTNPPLAGSLYALNFDGADDHVEAPAVTLAGSSFTIEAWARFTGQSNPGIILSQGTTNQNFQGIQFGFRAGGLFVFGFLTNDLQTPQAYADTNWHHWAGSYDVSTGARKLYRDGVLVASDVTADAYAGGGPLFIGTFLRNTYFQGSIDEVRLWTTPRLPDEIAANMNRLLRGTESGLAAYYRLDEGGGLFTRDTVSRASGQLKNGPLWDASPANPRFDTYLVPENGLAGGNSVSVFLPALDFDGAQLSYSVVNLDSIRAAGRFQNIDPGGAGPNWTFTPNTFFTGQVAVVYQVSKVAGGSTFTSGLATNYLSVLHVNQPPIVSSILNQVVEQDEVSQVLGPIAFTAFDPDNDPLTFSGRSSKPSLIPPDQITFASAGTNRTVTIRPAPDQLGVATVTIDIGDGQITTSRSFQVEVRPVLAYQVVDVGSLPGLAHSAATWINDRGHLVGYSASDTNGTGARAFYYGGFGDASGLVNLGTLGQQSIPLGINNSDQIVGVSAVSSNISRAFAYAVGYHTNVVDLGVLQGGDTSLAISINDAGQIAGSGSTGNGRQGAFLAQLTVSTTVTTVTNLVPTPNGVLYLVNLVTNQIPNLPSLSASLPLLPGATSMVAVAVNSAGQLVGTAHLTNGQKLAFVYFNGSLTNLGIVPGANDPIPTAINDQGVIVGWAGQPGGQTVAFVYRDGQMINLGNMFGGGAALPLGINTFGQIVGMALTTNGLWRPFFYESGQAFDLNSLLPENSPWTITDVRTINNLRQIAATARANIRQSGLTSSVQRAVILFPANEIGRQVPRPPRAIAAYPEIQLLDAPAGDAPDNAFYWSDFEGKLFSIRPVSARVRWRVSNLITDDRRVNALVFNVWPKRPDIYTANTPVQLEPNAKGFPYAFFAHAYTTINGANIDPSTKVYSAPGIGWSVIQFLRNEGQSLNPQLQLTYFDVVRVVHWNATNHLQQVPWTVGQPLTDSRHHDYPGLNGYVYGPISPIDAAGPDKAYDRSTRRGPILPVNVDSPTENDNLIAVWYATNRIGVAWSSYPVIYALRWPTNAPKIIIASLQGSGPLDPLLYRDARIYNQPDRALPGFNPNEEHAFIVPSSSGVAAFALRHDLNAQFNASEPFVLLKYKDPIVNEWRLRLYQVVREEAPYFLRYQAEAGKEVQPPMPLSVLPLPRTPHSFVSSGPFFQDYNFRIYASAAGLFGRSTNIVVRYYYPLQSDFYYDFNDDGTNDVAVGTPLAWLAPRLGNAEGTPVAVTYDVRWPADVPVLQIGETLTTARRGLPAVTGMKSLQAVYDSRDPDGTIPIEATARLYDPFSPRTVPLPAGFDFTRYAGLRLETGSLGEYLFPDLPYHLYLRLSSDPVNRTLTFKGISIDYATGEPLVLINVISGQERDRIKALIPGDSAWGGLVDSLYFLTRNPNQVDADRDGQVDKALRLGLATQFTLVANGVTNYVFAVPSNQLSQVTGSNVVSELLGDAPKGLTAGLPIPPADPRPGNALNFSGRGSLTLNLTNVNLPSFTISIWARISPTNTGYLFTNNPYAGATIFLKPEPANRRFLLSDRAAASSTFPEIQYDQFDNNWHFISLVRSVVSGQLQLYVDGQLIGQVNAGGLTDLRGLRIGEGFSGQLDEVRIWNYAQTNVHLLSTLKKRLLGGETGLVANWRFDEAPGSSTLADAGLNGFTATINLSGGSPALVPSDAPTGIPPRFVTLAENNDPKLGGLPVGLHLVRVDDGPAPGELKTLPAQNVFDERLILRHLNDFGGNPQAMEFEWYYRPDVDGSAPPVPVVAVDGRIVNKNNWLDYSRGAGLNSITLGEGGESSLLVLSDNWFIMRYRGYNINGQTNWSDWIGIGGGPMLAPGWIKRVFERINLFDQRTVDFANTAVNVLSSAISQAGARYEGDVAFNPDPNFLNRLGLIEIYETILRRARRLSIEGVPAVNYGPANNALLYAATRISDLYMLLGNEAFADAADPTVGFTTDSDAFGSLASTIFAFQNQLDSPIEEEVSLLRGRDDRSASTIVRPVYNRLFWNFTQGDGQVAYVGVYNVTDQNADGAINVNDARILYPQGHGDAWGHYLTALTTYYQLLRNINFTWVPRSESTLVGGVPVKVDYLDERKFAQAAAAKARTGARIVDLTYRLNYVADPNGQWQGYYDTDADRAWGVIEWGRRAGLGAYYDWVAANSLLPPVDPDPTHTGIDKIDRTTVTDLDEIAAQSLAIQTEIDRSDQGLNPLGLAQEVVPFDIDPTLFDPPHRLTHFEQVYDRANKSLQNALVTFNQANQLTSTLRRQQDTQLDFARNVSDQERDYKNRLIEIFGYPYSGDIGPGKAYPAGYDGPDLVHFAYVNVGDLTGQSLKPNSSFTAYFSKLAAHTNDGRFYFDDTPNLTSATLPVNFPYSTVGYPYAAPAEWGQRRAQGKTQEALGQMLQQMVRLQQGIARHSAALSDVQESADLLAMQYDVDQEKIFIRDVGSKTIYGMAAGIVAAKLTSLLAKKMQQKILSTAKGLETSLPKVVGLASDVSSAARGAIHGAALAGSLPFSTLQGASEASAKLLELGISKTADIVKMQLETQDRRLDVLERIKELEKGFRGELALRLELVELQQALGQSYQAYLSALAQGQRLVDERLAFRQRVAGQVSQTRYRDLAFRVFRNDALQKYEAQFDLAARYVFLAAGAYDYEVNLLHTDNRSGRKFFEDIIRQRSLGEIVNGNPVIGRLGLANSLARLRENFIILKPQLGLNNPQLAADRFSLRLEHFRNLYASTNIGSPLNNEQWIAALQRARVDNLWTLPEFRRFCRPFAPESAGPQPGLVIRFPTEVSFGRNFFNWPLGPADSFYDPSQFATKIRSVGVWFSGYNTTGLSQTPRVYLVPVGMDVLRSPRGDDFTSREWRVLDQKLPIPFPISQGDVQAPAWIPVNDSLGGSFAETRRHSSLRAFHDGSFDSGQFTSDSRLIGRSVWNTEWLLIVPGVTLLSDPNRGLDAFINTVTDIKLYFQSYSYSGN